MRPLWRQYSREADGFIFVVDANDRHRAADAADELRKFFGDGGKRSFVAPQTPLLVFANKQVRDDQRTRGPRNPRGSVWGHIGWPHVPLLTLGTSSHCDRIFHRP